MPPPYRDLLCPAWQGPSSAFPVIFAAAFFELCTHCCKPVLEDIDDRFADLGRRKGGSVYEPTPTIDFIFGADDHFTGVAIHPDKALGFLNPLHQIVDAHGLGLHWRSQVSNLAPFTLKAAALPPPMSISGLVSILECSSAHREARAAFEQYWRRLRARPEAMRAKKIHDALAAEKSASATF